MKALADLRSVWPVPPAPAPEAPVLPPGITPLARSRTDRLQPITAAFGHCPARRQCLSSCSRTDGNKLERNIVLAGLMTASALSLMGAAWATPPGVRGERWRVRRAGRRRSTFARDTTPGKSACNGQCATNWPPLAAAADAKDDGQWSVVTRDDGAKMWAYKGKPLYTYVRDTAVVSPRAASALAAGCKVDSRPTRRRGGSGMPGPPFSVFEPR